MAHLSPQVKSSANMTRLHSYSIISSRYRKLDFIERVYTCTMRVDSHKVHLVAHPWFWRDSLWQSCTLQNDLPNDSAYVTVQHCKLENAMATCKQMLAMHSKCTAQPWICTFKIQLRFWGHGLGRLDDVHNWDCKTYLADKASRSSQLSSWQRSFGTGNCNWCTISQRWCTSACTVQVPLYRCLTVNTECLQTPNCWFCVSPFPRIDVLIYIRIITAHRDNCHQRRVQQERKIRTNYREGRAHVFSCS